MYLRKKVNKSSLYTEFVNILNGVLQLSKREAEVLSLMIAADANGAYEDVNSKVVRAAITSHLGISEPNLSKYLNVIKSKGLIVKSPKNKWVLNDYIRPTIIDGVLEVSIALNIDNEERKVYASESGS